MGQVCIVGAAFVLSLLLGIGAQVVESSSAPTVKVASGDLAARINSFVAAISRSGNEGYDTPTNPEQGDMVHAYNAIQAGKLSQAASIIYRLKYDVVRYKDTVISRTLIILSERQIVSGCWRQSVLNSKLGVSETQEGRGLSCLGPI
jgi:hypothetical protein